MERYGLKRTSYERGVQRRRRKQKKEDKTEQILLLQTGVCALLFGALFLCLWLGEDWKISAQKMVNTVFSQKELAVPAMAEFQDLTEWHPEKLRQAIYTWVHQYIVPKTETKSPPKSKDQNESSKNLMPKEEVRLLEGQGGWFPVEREQGSDLTRLDAVTPPQGTTLSPVISTAKLTAPVTGPVTSAFGYRYHPITFDLDFHTGLDIAAVEGTAIHAVLPGVVRETGTSPSYGNYIVVEHSSNFYTTYNHCREIIAEEGTVLRKGDRIATVGSTGISTGPHVHFETIVNGQKADPMWLL